MFSEHCSGSLTLTTSPSYFILLTNMMYVHLVWPSSETRLRIVEFPAWRPAIMTTLYLYEDCYGDYNDDCSAIIGDD